MLGFEQRGSKERSNRGLFALVHSSETTAHSSSPYSSATISVSVSDPARDSEQVKCHNIYSLGGRCG